MEHEEIIIMQNKIIISLLGRAHFPEDKLKSIIMKNKRFPGAYLMAYNACDGKTNVTDIARLMNITQATLTPILKDWENLGIVYSIDTTRGKNYLGLYKINISKEEIKDIKTQEEKQSQNNEGVESELIEVRENA